MSPPRKPDGIGVSTRATVVRVLDGDTIEVSWYGRKLKLRLLDCWVLDDSVADNHAAEFLRQFVGKPVIVLLPTDQVDSLLNLVSFNRILAWIWPLDDDESLNEAIIRNGWGTREKPKS